MADAGIEDRLHSLVRASQSVVQELDLAEVLRLIAREAVHLADARYGALGVLAPDGRELEQFIHVGVDDETVARVGALPRGHGLLGTVIRDPIPIRVDDLHADARSEGFPAGHPPMRSFLGVPIRVRDAVFGNLYLTEKRTGSFTAEDERILTALAATAGVAIANARMFDDTQRRQRWAQASAELMGSLVTGTMAEALTLLTTRINELADADLSCVVIPSGPHDLVVTAAVGAHADELQGVRYAREGSLAGAALAAGRAMSVAHARTRGVPEYAVAALGHTLVVPLAGAAETQGVLSVSRLPGQEPFPAEIVELAAEFARHASVALELGRARRSAAKLALLEDRERIARDLHDHVIQRLFGAGLGLQATMGQIAEPEVAAAVGRQIDALDAAIVDIRTAVFAFSAPGGAAGQSVRHRIVDVIGEMGHLFPSPPHLTFTGAVDLRTDVSLAADVEAVVREGLSNAKRHARAARVDVSVAVVDDVITVTIADDGVGIPDGAVLRGLANLRQRAELRGGRLLTAPVVPRGTRVEWAAPTCDGETR
ncbi:signal transduction histidine kinase [Clavibacter michiganensis]|uniref:GAF domain-containing sensor histidine kinase n=1 Tax=Clavibacter michiganensis TaxID=28447 RepID=UPI001AE7108B|nr:GAF domain-containing sensor histidine kinase [Clavibacter michiganensis]MBP2458393.1 signal transduction histidine kinase [Clavibacter michiganensis]MDQ0410964.1 signal transduction histidine kinase [Clavibacter michiganensis]